MALQRYASLLLAQELRQDSLGSLHRGWELDGKGRLRPVLVRKMAPAFDLDPVHEALREPPELPWLPASCGTGHGFGSRPGPHWKQEFRGSRSLRSVADACIREGFPFGLAQGLNLAWSLLQTVTTFWRQGRSAGPLSLEEVRLDFEGRLFLPDLAWLTVLGQARGAHPTLGKALRDFPEPPAEGSLVEEARRLGRFLAELFAFQKLPEGVAGEELAAWVQVWSPEGPEPLPDEVRRPLARLLGVGEPFETLDQGLEDFRSLVFGMDEGPSTFNLAYLMHTLFRQDLEAEQRGLEEERELALLKLRSNQEPALAAPAAPTVQEARSRPWLKIVVASGLVGAAAGAAGFLHLRANERQRRGLESELLRIQSEYQAQLQHQPDPAAQIRSQEELREQLQRLASQAQESAQKERIRDVIRQLPPPKPAAVEASARLPALPPTGPVAVATVPGKGDSARVEAPLPVPSPAAPKVAPSPAAEAPAAAGAGLIPPKVLRQQPLEWPAGQPRVPVRIRVFLHESGRPLRVLPAPGFQGSRELLQAAQDAAMRSLYAPAQQGGKPARDWVELQF